MYTVAAVDSASNVGTQAGANAYLYHGISFANSGNFDYGTVHTNYADTSCGSASGPYDMFVTWPGPISGGFQPVYSPGNNQSLATMGLMSLENFNTSGFQYMVMDIKVADLSYQTHALQSSPIARGYGSLSGSPDVFLSGDTDLNIVGGTYGSPSVGNWVTIKIPLSATSYGTTSVQGYFTGTAQYTGTLVVTSVGAHTAAIIGGSAYVSGSGMPATSAVTSGTAGGTGTYTVTGPNIVGTEVIGSSGSPVSFTLNRNIAYKVGTQWTGSIPSGTSVCIDNFGFTASRMWPVLPLFGMGRLRFRRRRRRIRIGAIAA